MQDDKKRDSAVEFILIIVGIVVIYFILKYTMGDKIAYYWWYWQGLKVDVIQMFYEFELLQRLKVILNQKRNWNDVTLFQSLDVADIVGGYLRWVFIPIVAYWAWSISKQNPLHKLRNRHTRSSLVKSEVGIWKHVKPILQLNLTKESTVSGAWASGKNPIEYAKENHLFKKGEELDKEKVEKVFTAQLSKVWAGIDKLDPITKAFFAIFAAHGNWDGEDPKYKTGRDEARNGINILASSFLKNKKKLDVSWVDEMIEKHAEHPDVQEIIEQHAYTHTLMMSLLEYARKKGVFPSSEFFWLRAIDRKLWYALNNVGRSVAWTEVAGIYGHWLAEKANGEAVIRPYVQKSVEAFAEAVKNIKLKKKKREKQKNNNETQ